MVPFACECKTKPTPHGSSFGLRLRISTSKRADKYQASAPQSLRASPSTTTPNFMKSCCQLFRECYWLAEPETRTHYADLLEFIEVWNRWIDKALPPEVLERLNHGEDNLTSFYEHIEQMHTAIRQKLKDGAP